MITGPRVILLGLLLGVLFAPAKVVWADDAEPHQKVKLCNPSETLCTDVVSSVSASRAAAQCTVQGSSGTVIGNVGDRLKVDAQFTSVTTTVPSWSKNLRYDDMNVSTGGIARGTTLSGGVWTTVYFYSGSGYLAGMLVNVDTFATGWDFRLTIDGVVIYTLLDTDLVGDALYDLDDITDVNQAYLGVSKGSHDRFVWHPPMNSPMYYASSVQVEIRKNGGGKKFQAGLIILSKES